MKNLSTFTVTRRDVLKGFGLGAGGLCIGLGKKSIAAILPKVPTKLNAFVHIAPDSTVTIMAHRSEMGQGARTSIPMLIADELGANWSKVNVLQGDGNTAYGSQNTDGSSSIRGVYPTLREVGAKARKMLEMSAAKKWKVSPNQVKAKDHRVWHEKTGRSMTFGEAAVKADAIRLPAKIALKKKSELRYVGKSKPIVDSKDFTTGRATFASDAPLPSGKKPLVAVVERPPAVGANVSSYNKKDIEALPGVRATVTLDSVSIPTGFSALGGVAIIADSTWQAFKARKALKVKWEASEHSGYDSEAYKASLTKTLEKGPFKVGRKQGDGKTSSRWSSFTQDYYVPHLAQAPMEPPACLADFQNGKLEVWACTQHPVLAQKEIAKALLIKEKDVTVHVTLLGGGFGRKSKPDFLIEAAKLSQEVGKPVRVQWTREDDIRHGFYHSVSAQRLSASVSKKGRVKTWHHRTAFPPIASTFAPGAANAGDGELGMSAVDVPLKAKNILVENGAAKAHVRIGWMRSVANIHQSFASCSFLDELAHASKADPVDFFLANTANKLYLDRVGITTPWDYGSKTKEPVDLKRLKHVLRKVAKMSDWESRGSRKLGIAAVRSFGSFVATAIEVETSAKGIKLIGAYSAIDAGTIIHRDRVLAQLEGGIVFGLSLAIYGNITAKHGAIEQSNFHDYRMLRMNEMPKTVKTAIVKSSRPPGGVGEPGVPPVAPALANAIFAATGNRERELPLHKKYRFLA